MSDFYVHALTVFLGLFAIMNPVANLPIFLSLTADEDEASTIAIAVRALVLAFAITALFALAGKFIFDLFGITLPAFRITGGLLVFLIGFHMLQGDQSSVHHPKGESDDESRLSVAVSPLAVPILAGPGTIATAMNFSMGGGFTEMLVTIGSFGVLCVLTYFCFIYGEKAARYLGASALGAITRMMGLILAVIGTQMVIEGIKGAFLAA